MLVGVSSQNLIVTYHRLLGVNLSVISHSVNTVIGCIKARTMHVAAFLVIGTILSVCEFDV